MTSTCRTALALLASVAATVLGAPARAETADVISIGNDVTEIIFALDQDHRLLARDSTSNYPPEALELPNVGYTRALSTEGVLSLGPSLIIATESAGPPEVIDVLRAAGLDYVMVPDAVTGEGLAEKIRIVGAALDVPEKAEALSAVVLGDLEAAQAKAAEVTEPKRVMFIISARGGKLMAAGVNTSAAAVIEMAGGVNAVTGYEGYKVLEDEAATAAAPDLVLMIDRTGEHDASGEELFSLPALSATPAALTKALYKMDGPKLLGFGPRVGETVRELQDVLYSE